MELKDAGVSIRVYDTPGFGSNKKENKKYIKEIRKNCELVDVIFLCIRMDDQLRVEDQETITLLAKEFGVKFWKKTLIVFTRANMVKRMGQHKIKYSSEQEYLIAVKQELTEAVMGVFKNAKIESPSLASFVIAGAPEFSPDSRVIPCIDDNSQDLQVDWLPAVVRALFQSGCSDNGKACLLKSGWGKWASASTGYGAGTIVGVAIGSGVLGAGAVTLELPPLGLAFIAIGGTIILISLAVGGSSSVASGAKAANNKAKKKRKIDELEEKMKKTPPSS